MIWRKLFYGICLLLAGGHLSAQNSVSEKPRLTVAEGLPQSYVSGLAQDKAGFIWVATRDGLARYDGRKFKAFRHRPGDTSSLSANIITNLFLDRAQQLWIQFEGGDIDILNTITERLVHFTKDPVYKIVRNKVKNMKSAVQDHKDRHWLLADSGLFVIDLPSHRIDFHSYRQLGLSKPMLGLATAGDSMLAVTDTAILIMNAGRKVMDARPYTFANPHLFNPERPWKDNSPVLRDNGDLVIIDENRLIICHRQRDTFTVLPLPATNFYIYIPRAQDEQDNILFGFEGSIYMLTSRNEFKAWNKEKLRPGEKPISMLLDRSGVLWVGTNGFSLRQFDLRVPRMPGYSYHYSFPEDIFERNLHIPRSVIANSLLAGINPYLFRWVSGDDGRIWACRSESDTAPEQRIAYYQGGRLFLQNWKYKDRRLGKPPSISALAFSQSGQMWGVDHLLNLIRIDTTTNELTTVTRLFMNRINSPHSINSMVIDGETVFWISTSLGLVRYDMASGNKKEFTGTLPVSELTTIVNDPTDRNILWIGALSGGLIRLNKLDYTYRIFTTDEGLPNNTIYTILSFKNQLWCSSNKGIFSFNVQSGQVRSYTTLDGLPGDEFNRFHFLKLPDGQLAFGGSESYTVFDPQAINYDEFAPPVVLTGLKINNREAGYGIAGSTLKETVNSLDALSLSHDQNFLVFEFAALEYNIPDKLNYRYIMEGLDKEWIGAGTNNTATYTSLPPGRYIFKVNATNTAGDWSRHIKEIHIVIRPPFWLTWWFITLCMLLAGSLITLFIRWRLNEVRKQEQQKHRFEKEVIELQAQALRAQMNPHFIFNCLNSIKALIQENKQRQAIIYLTTFSKLIRNTLSNTRQKISLYSEIETCKLYVQMESLRFGDRITCEFIIGENVDTHALLVPPLFLQPLIENAFWHGILPLESNGRVTVQIRKDGHFLYCLVEDNGIGRERSGLRKEKNDQLHESKGMQLIRDRVRLHNNGMENDIEVIDKMDNYSRPAGTLVIIKFKLDHD